MFSAVGKSTAASQGLSAMMVMSVGAFANQQRAHAPNWKGCLHKNLRLMRCGSRTRARQQQRSFHKHPAPPRSRQEPGTMQTPQNGTRCASQPRQTVPATPVRRRNGGHAGGTVRTGRAQRSDGTAHGPQPTSGSPLRPLSLGGAAAVAASLSAAAASASAAAGTHADAAVVAAATAAAYTPGPVEVGWELWAGFIAGVIPFAIATVEFSKRIVSHSGGLCGSAESLSLLACAALSNRE